jgi:DNA-binding IclR family transcriptional regulator
MNQDASMAAGEGAFTGLRSPRGRPAALHNRPTMTASHTPRAKSADTVSALDRGLALLQCFREGQRALGATELSRMTGIPRPTVTRLADTLVANRWLRAEPGGERYMLGAGVVSLAQVFLSGLDVRGSARGPMQALAERTGGSVYLAVRDGMEMVIVEACRPRSSMLATRIDVGSRAPLPVSALGRAFLAALDAPQRQQLIDSLRLLRGAEWGSVAPGMERAIDEAHRLGYCLSLGEFHREINSVSVALVGPTGEVMALNCGGPAFHFSEQGLREDVAPALVQMATGIAAEIGGRVVLPAQAAALSPP